MIIHQHHLQAKKMNSQNLSSQTRSQLIARYEAGKIWLQEHKAQDGTQNAFDINGNVHDEEVYKNAEKLLNDIEKELNTRYSGWDDPEYEQKQSIVNESKIIGAQRGFFTFSQLTKSEKEQFLKRYFDENIVVMDEDEFEEEMRIIKSHNA